MSKLKTFVICSLVSCAAAVVAAFAATVFMFSRPDIYAAECSRQMGELALLPADLQNRFWQEVDKDEKLSRRFHLVRAIAIARDKVEAEGSVTK